MKKVVITGAGQLAWELKKTAPAEVEIISLTRAELDLTDENQIASRIHEHAPDVVINAAAYTAVDKAEEDHETAFAVNRDAVKVIAETCARHSIYLLHVSTDFVFDGRASRPYAVDSARKPLGVYGKSKAEGEAAIAATSGLQWAVIRTAWVYSSFGNNFVKTMLRLMSEKPALGIVGDQVGTPTWARGLAQACWAVAAIRAEGLYHWTDAGVASWYDFAVAIQREAINAGLLDTAIPINSIRTEDYPTPAARPSFSVLDKTRIIEDTGIPLVHWQDQLTAMLCELKNT